MAGCSQEIGVTKIEIYIMNCLGIYGDHSKRCQFEMAISKFRMIHYTVLNKLIGVSKLCFDFRDRNSMWFANIDVA